MRTELYKITTGSLLHDVGKVVHRTGDSHSHAESGYAFLKEQTGLDENEMRLEDKLKRMAKRTSYHALGHSSVTYVS